MSDSPVEAVAEAWASIDGKLQAFRDGKGKRLGVDDLDGSYPGYMAEAEEMIRRLQKRGYTVARLPE